MNMNDSLKKDKKTKAAKTFLIITHPGIETYPYLKIALCNNCLFLLFKTNQI